MRYFLALIVALALTGCATRIVTRDELDQRIFARSLETTDSGLRYMGSRGGYHYLRHTYLLGFKNYRISEEELEIDSPFSLTNDESVWRTLKRFGEPWPLPQSLLNHFMETNQPIRFIPEESDPIDFFDSNRQQIGDGNAVKPPGVERTP